MLENPDPTRPPRGQRRVAGLLVAALAALAAQALPAAASVVPLRVVAPRLEQDARPKRLDQVAVRARRGNSITQVPGVVQKCTLAEVVLKVGDKDERYPSELVVRVLYGDVPPSYRDGMLYLDRGEHASAAQSFLQAAGDGEAREVVRAAARLRAAESLHALGAREPARFSGAADETRRFLTDFPDNLEVPRAQMVLARSLWLAGQPAEAAAVYRQVYDKLSGDAAASGYDRAGCYRAGLLAARALLDADDTLGARELFSALASRLGPVVAGQEDSPEARQLEDVLAEASLGEGFAELAAGNGAPALTFFKSRDDALDASSPEALRFGVLLGLGESLLAQGQARQAQLALAEVSALDHTDRDRVARALLRQAEAGLRLQDPREGIKALLTTLDTSYGDTPWAAPAREMLKTL